MKVLAIFNIMLFVWFNVFAQCTSGNCKTGVGTYNYGWCVYSGEFKNGKPEGKGTMSYDDYTYTGFFVNGLEDGDGLITNKDGTHENARYNAGKKVASGLVRVAAGEYKPLDIQNIKCIDGNCNTGFGTFQFASGGKYTGNFKDQMFEGQGTFTFTNGDKFEGIFHNNEKSSGIYHYNTGAMYAGTYDGKGTEYNGAITSPAGMKIPYVNGKPIIPPAPKVPVDTDLRGDPSKPAAPTGRIKTTCYVCFGSGVQKRIEDWSGPSNTHLVSVSVSCYKCHGSGVE